MALSARLHPALNFSCALPHLAVAGAPHKQSIVEYSEPLVSGGYFFTQLIDRRYGETDGRPTDPRRHPQLSEAWTFAIVGSAPRATRKPVMLRGVEQLRLVTVHEFEPRHSGVRALDI